jgi:homoserine kinase
MLSSPKDQRATIRVRAPATSANLGSGFDCLGLALDLWNEVAATPGGPETDSDNLILRAAQVVFQEVGVAYPGFELDCTNRVPFGRGLGSSAAAIVSGLLVANASLARPLDEASLIRLATRIEGHPDNVVPCLLGGARVATGTENGHIVQAKIPVASRLVAVAFIPEQTVPTAHARGLLPVSVPLRDALFNVARSSLLVAALASGQLDALAEATQDRLHQPYRMPLFPAGATLLEVAMQSGGLGAFMSGAGPSVLALCADEARAESVAAAYESTARQLRVPGVALRVALVDRGAHVVE